MHENRQIVKLGLSAFLILFAVMFVFGCAAKTKVYGIKPAEISVGGIRTLAVLKFDGQHGETVRSDFYNKLAEIEHFSLIDTTQMSSLERVIYDQIDDPRVLPTLENIHADGVITGRVTADVNDIRGYDQVQMKEGTGRYKKQKNIFGKWVDVEVKRTVLRPVPYIIRQASLTTGFKVFDLRTRKIIATGKVTENYNEKFGGSEENALFFGDKLSELPAPNQTINELSSKVAAALVAKISPTRIATIVQFDDGGKYGFGGHTMIKRGIEFAKRGAWKEAMEIWKEVIKTEPTNSAAYYNLGLGYENFGGLKNLENARTMYKKAAMYGDNTLYIEAVARINTAVSNCRKYEQQKRLLEKTPVKKSDEGGGVRIY